MDRCHVIRVHRISFFIPQLLESKLLLLSEICGGESTNVTTISLHGEWYDFNERTNHHPVSGTFDLEWLGNECSRIVNSSASQLPQDELAMAICRVLDSDKAGDKIVGDLLDLVGDGAFETVQDLLKHRKELVDAIHHGMLNLKPEKAVSSSQPPMPSYGTQVTVQTESEKQFDKLRRKEEKKQKCGTDSDLSLTSFSSLLHASAKKSPFDDLIGHGEGSNTLAVAALPQENLVQ